MARNTALFQNAANMIKHAPTTARSSASLRSSPLYVGLRCVADAPSLRAQFSFFTLPRGSAASPLHRRALLKFSGILLLFDVQSSTTEKEQKDRHLLFLRRGGARTPGWDYTRKIVRDPSLPVFQRLRVLSRIVDWNISILRTSVIEMETQLQYHNST